MRYVLFLVLVSSALYAHDPITTGLTWTEQISRIVQNRCQSCHVSGGKAPMPLTTYEEVRPWAKAIKEEVLERRMPPWGAVRGFGHLRDNRSLTLTEIAAIADWVEGGAPEGDSKFLPPAKQAESAKHPELGPSVVVKSDTRLNSAFRIQAVELVKSDAKSVKLYLDRPDGSSEPLLWIYQPPAVPPIYYLAEVTAIPPGTVIRSEPRVEVSLRVWAAGSATKPLLKPSSAR